MCDRDGDRDRGVAAVCAAGEHALHLLVTAAVQQRRGADMIEYNESAANTVYKLALSKPDMYVEKERENSTVQYRAS